jgi:hypothetical protein
MQEAVDRAVNQALGKAFDDADFFEDAGEDTLGFVNEIRSNENFQVWTPPVAEGEADSGFAHVYLVFQDWGKVSSETDDFGDWATRTATFYVPVQHMVGGRCVRVGLVPIVTLSEGTAQTCTLTELYGIQATEASFEEPRLEWYPPQPGAPRNLMSVKTMVLPSLGRGERTRKREILKVHYLKPDKQEVEKCKRCSAEADSDDSKEATQQMADALPDASELGANVPTADNGLPQDLYAEAFGAVDRGPTERPPMRRCQQAAAEVLALFRSISVYTLKQFRDEATPERACYQALLRIPWTMQKLRSVIVQKGKIQIKIADFPSLPIVSQLGLLPVKVEGGEGATVYTVEAVDAFTVQGDLRLGNAEELRTRVSAGRFAWRINKDRSPAAPPVASGDYGPILQRLEHASNDQLDEFRREVREGVLEHHGVSAAIKGSKPPPPNFDGVGDSNNSYLPALRSYGPQEILRSLLGRNPDTVPTIVATQLHGGADS